MQVSIEMIKVKLADLVIENEALKWTIERQNARIKELEEKYEPEKK